MGKTVVRGAAVSRSKFRLRPTIFPRSFLLDPGPGKWMQTILACVRLNESHEALSLSKDLWSLTNVDVQFSFYSINYEAAADCYEFGTFKIKIEYSIRFNRDINIPLTGHFPRIVIKSHTQ